MVLRQRMGGGNHSGRDGTEVGLGQKWASQPPHNIRPAPSAIRCWNPT